ncbi:MAG: hypothetical protein ACTSQK_05905 [Candidatus Heimdallarchaeota archaeon]
MANGRFWKVTANIFIIAMQILWLCVVFTFVILPMLIVLPIRRSNAKIRTQRKMVKNGMPRKHARIVARKYRSMLYDYGSIIGLLKIAKISKGKTNDDNEEENEITEPKKKTRKKLNNLSFIT